MRISVLKFLILTSFFGFSVSLSAHQCLDFLVKEEVLNKKRAPLLQTQLESVDHSLQILEKLYAFKMVKRKYYKHAKKDLEGTRHEIEEHWNEPGFASVMGEWSQFLDRSLGLMESYESMDAKEKKRWKSKFDLLGRFSVGQFVTFIEKQENVRVGERQIKILRSLNAVPDDVSLTVFFYELEKQNKRFFSLSEIKRCKF